MTTTPAPPSVFTSRDLGPAPERQVARDLLKHGAMALPVALLIGFIGWGTAGLLSVGYAGGLILLNFWVAAMLLGWAARISLGLLMGSCLGVTAQRGGHPDRSRRCEKCRRHRRVAGGGGLARQPPPPGEEGRLV